MRIERILHCTDRRRCGAHLSCKRCAETWQKKNFAMVYDVAKDIFGGDDFYYYVISPRDFLTLGAALELMYLFMDELRELKKRKKISALYGRLEVSFKFGYFVHINILSKNLLDIREICEKYRLKIYVRQKKFEAIASILWYILKFNNIGIERGEMVRTALKKRETIIKTEEFKKRSAYEYSEGAFDWGVFGVCSIRSKEEVRYRRYIMEERRNLSNKLRNFLQNLNADV